MLSEGDDPQDPIADAARGILDGHIVLSRELAEAGHFPAIDVERSISRVMTSVASREQVAAARRARQLLAKHNKARDLIQLGAYVAGHDAELDTAVALQPGLSRFLQQDMHEPAALGDSFMQLAALAGAVNGPMQSLDTLLQRDTLQRDQAQALLRQAEDEAQRAERQARDLHDYRSQYQARWAGEFGRGSTMQTLLCYRSFMQRLDQALQQQSQHSHQVQQKVQRMRDLLLQRERQLASVLKMIERQCAELQRAGRRHEQKQIDELAQRMHQRRSSEGNALPWP